MEISKKYSKHSSKAHMPLTFRPPSIKEKMHLENIKAQRVCKQCGKHRTRYQCGECDYSVCLIPCYDLHRFETENAYKPYDLING